MTNWGIIGAGGIARVHVSLIHPHHAEWAIEAARGGGAIGEVRAVRARCNPGSRLLPGLHVALHCGGGQGDLVTRQCARPGRTA